MFIIYIGRNVIETRTKRLIRKREQAFANRDYKKVWILNTKIDKNINRLFSWCCYEI